jgi:signal transduction histidine kinase
MGNRFTLLLFLSFVFNAVLAQHPIVFKGETELLLEHSRYYVDSSGQRTHLEIRAKMEKGIGWPATIDLDYVKHPVWIRMEVENQSLDESMMVIFENPLIDSISFYEDSASDIAADYNFLGDGFEKRKYSGTFQRFLVNVPLGEKKVLYFCVRSTEQMVLPLKIATATLAAKNNDLRDLIYGAFMGVILVMVFYNLFVFAATRDQNYLYYVFYIFCIGLGQIALSGHLYSLMFFNWPYLFKNAIVVFPAFSGIFAVIFIQQFLNGKQLEPKLNRLLSFVALFYGLAGLVRIFGYDQVSARMMDIVGLPGSVVVFIMAFRVYHKGFNSAKYFIGAWFIFIFGVVLFVFRNLGILPFNWFTSYTLPMGAAIEVALLSFALADKINTLQKQKQEKEKEALFAALENERLIKEQNIMLEKKVAEKTIDLTKSNEQLTVAMEDLKSTQSQLVEQEKMASLGQLTAGIAHEINNPINFVTSNISPLKRDIGMIEGLLVRIEELCVSDMKIEDKIKEIGVLKEEIDYDYLKEEMDFLLKGIDEGAHRTAEIVKGLRIFARNDEDSIVHSDIIEGIESTLVILNNQISKIKVNKGYSSSVFVDCYPGKLNQVFLNLLSNSIYAVNEKFGEELGGEITISIRLENDFVFISFEDNGIGMDEEMMKKIFEPFFTTKPVGQGTGLGMSIVYKTIEMHKGEIAMRSKKGFGTVAELKLKLNHSL